MKTSLPILVILAVLLLAGCGEKDSRDPVLIQAEAGDVAAQYSWAEKLYQSGEIGAAVSWYRKAASKDHGEATRQLMVLLVEGKAGEELIPEGLTLAWEMGQAGDDGAKALYARALLEGKHLEQNEVQAHALLEELEQSRHPYGLYWKVLKAVGDSGLPNSLAEQRRLQDLLETAAKGGIKEAQYMLGTWHEEQDKSSDADKFYLEAASQGYPPAQYKMGLAYRRLGNHPRYAPLAFENLKAAVDGGIEEAVFPLAHSYYNGVGTLTKKDEALEWMRLGAALGQVECVDFLLKSEYSDKDWERSQEVFIACLLRITAGLDEKMVDAIRSRLPDPDYLFFEEVDFEIKKLDLRARQYRARFDATVAALSAEEEIFLRSEFSDRYGEHKALFLDTLGNRDGAGMFELAKRCFDQEQSFFSEKEAIYWIEGAIYHDHAEAGLWVYESFLDGSLAIVSEDQAIEALKAASRKEHPEAAYCHALELISGERMDQDYRRAVGLLAIAHENGHPLAREKAKDMLRAGRGILKRSNSRLAENLMRMTKGDVSLQVAQQVAAKFTNQSPQTFVWSIIEELAAEEIPRFEFLWYESELKEFERSKRFNSFRPPAYLATHFKKQFPKLKHYYNFTGPSRGSFSERSSVGRTEDEQLEDPIRKARDVLFRLAVDGYRDAQLVVSGWKLLGYYGEKDEAGALGLWKALAEKDHPDGYFLWGFAQFLGWRCDKDIIAGSLLLRKAAEAGQDQARGMFSDFNSAMSEPSFIERIYLAVKKQDSEAMLSLAAYFHDTKDYDETYAREQYFMWMSEAAKAGSLLALRVIGAAYLGGDGVEKNPLRAIRFIEQAAKLGDADAQFDAGWLYSTGEAITRDHDKALRYLKMAADQGHKQAKALVTTLESLSKESRVEGSAFRNAVVSTMLNQDFFPLKPVVLRDGEIFPVSGVKSKFPVYNKKGRPVSARKNDPILFFAAPSFGAGKVEDVFIEYTAPIIRVENGWAYTGNSPSVTVRCQTQSPLNEVYFLLVIRDYNDDFTYYWRPLGDMIPGKEYRERISGLDEKDLFYDGEDLVIYFFSEGREIITDERRQLQYFVSKGLEGFTEDKMKYLADSLPEDRPPGLYEDIPYALFGDLKYPSGFKAVFGVSKLGFVSDLELPKELNKELRQRFYEVFSRLNFLPCIKNGRPVASKAIVPIE